MTQRFLVTGGAGYVGSHVVAALLDRGDAVTILDNLRTGHRPAVPPGAAFVQGDLADEAAIDAVLAQGLAEGPWTAVLHFAALSQVGESMRMPMRYLLDNGANGIRLIDACIRHGVTKFVLSSTAALFNVPGNDPIPEDAPIDPQSAYGESKYIIERALRWAHQVHGLRYACLRYFNAAGADPAGRFGEDHRPETHLIPLVIDAALGRRAALEVYGDDYPTQDGTCIRDYVHVSDLASAHLLAVERLDDGPLVWNLGNGLGHSVREVIASVERVSGLKVPYRMAPRRPGDAAVLVASSQRAQAAGWRPVHADLDEIVRTAFAWRQSHPDGYGKQA
ncbi:MAG TPA: UDP-glucose 4-epimerase GalE [Rhodopila sp.]|uniref:UDP-glucose 4-epimerase GalE n=1 Tax=Rhodopila sp. TaxID=2480087 RepID=UPI002CC8E0D7|nr:UDP-glucose 4-epimerase GalE [Rhodopila sp.]HVY14814.1 UDP-glucose 4-epimerase GalE [Rhodopila sp.]